MPLDARVVGWLIAVVTAVGLDFVLFRAWLLTAVEENCNNGVDRWQCSEVVRTAAPIGTLIMVIVTLVLIVVAILDLSSTVRRSSRRDETG